MDLKKEQNSFHFGYTGGKTIYHELL